MALELNPKLHALSLLIFHQTQSSSHILFQLKLEKYRVADGGGDGNDLWEASKICERNRSKTVEELAGVYGTG